jgi:hypothetical protein
MGKNNISDEKLKLGIISFNYRRGDLFILIMFIAALKCLLVNEAQYAIFFLLAIIWREINRMNYIKSIQD